VIHQPTGQEIARSSQIRKGKDDEQFMACDTARNGNGVEVRCHIQNKERCGCLSFGDRRGHLRRLFSRMSVRRPSYLIHQTRAISCPGFFVPEFPRATARNYTSSMGSSWRIGPSHAPDAWLGIQRGVGSPPLNQFQRQHGASARRQIGAEESNTTLDCARYTSSKGSMEPRPKNHPRFATWG